MLMSLLLLSYYRFILFSYLYLFIMFFLSEERPTESLTVLYASKDPSLCFCCVTKCVMC